MTAAVELRGVTKAYGRVPAVCGVTLAAGAGELLTVVGPSGCGKSTLLGLVAGLETPDTGEVRIDGAAVAGPAWVPPERRRVGMVFQDHALFPHLSVAQNVAFGLASPGAGRRSGRRARRQRVAEVLDLVHLGHLADRHPHELSGGEQQRVALARALAPGPAVVLLDEPFSSLDETLRARVRQETVRALRETGTTAVLVTHDQTEALSVGDRVCVLREGVVEQVGPPPEVFERPHSRFVATFLGDADFLPTAEVDGVLVCELGTVTGRAALHGEVDGGLDGADVVLRPHEVNLSPGPAEQGCPGEVVAVEYQGSLVLHTVRLPSGRTVRSWQPHQGRHPVGEQVAVSLVTGVRPRLLIGDRSVEE